MTWKQFKGIKGLNVVQPKPVPTLSSAALIQWLRDLGVKK